MNLRQIFTFSAVAALLAGAETYEARARRILQAELAHVQHAADAARWQIAIQHRLYHTSADTAAAVFAEGDAADPFVSTGDPKFDTEGRELLRRVYALRKWIDGNPVEWIPEIQHARDSDWFEAVAHRSPWDDATLPAVAAQLRHEAKFAFLASVQRALSRYLEKNNGMRPTNAQQLAAYFAGPCDEAALARYQVPATGPLRNISKDAPVLEEQMSPSDRDDAEIVSINGMSVRVKSPDVGSTELRADRKRSREIFRAIASYEKSHGGDWPTDTQQLMPFVTDPSLLEGVEMEEHGFRTRMEEVPPEMKW